MSKATRDWELEAIVAEVRDASEKYVIDPERIYGFMSALPLDVQLGTAELVAYEIQSRDALALAEATRHRCVNCGEPTYNRWCEFCDIVYPGLRNG